MREVPLIGIVDDDIDIPAALGSLLRSIGYRTESFSCASEFLSRQRVQKFDCVISDIHMPHMSGLELVATLASISNGLPVVLMTGRFEQGLEDRVRDSGAASFVIKPFGLQEIAGKLETAIRRKK